SAAASGLSLLRVLCPDRERHLPKPGADIHRGFVSSERGGKLRRVCSGRTDVLAMGGSGSRVSSAGTPGLLACQAGWTAAPHPCPVFPIDGVLLLAVLER